MTTAPSTAAKGKVLRSASGGVEFQPSGTSYELHLKYEGGAYTGPIGTPVHGAVRVTARKVYSVPSGGNFIQPIFGPPRVIQGRVIAIEDDQIVIHAGTPIRVTLPEQESAIDLNSGSISPGTMVNVIALPGATFEYRGPATACD